jgi:hypothetical protein
MKVDEELEQGTRIASITVADPDFSKMSGVHQQVDCSVFVDGGVVPPVDILPGPENTYALVATGKGLDYEAGETLIFNVQCQDNNDDGCPRIGDPQGLRAESVKVTLTVLPINDAPRVVNFEAAKPRPEEGANADPTKSIGQIVAEDEDGGAPDFTMETAGTSQDYFKLGELKCTSKASRPGLSDKKECRADVFALKPLVVDREGVCELGMDGATRVVKCGLELIMIDGDTSAGPAKQRQEKVVVLVKDKKDMPTGVLITWNRGDGDGDGDLSVDGTPELSQNVVIGEVKVEDPDATDDEDITTINLFNLKIVKAKSEIVNEDGAVQSTNGAIKLGKAGARRGRRKDGDAKGRRWELVVDSADAFDLGSATEGTLELEFEVTDDELQATKTFSVTKYFCKEAKEGSCTGSAPDMTKAPAQTPAPAPPDGLSPNVIGKNQGGADVIGNNEGADASTDEFGDDKKSSDDSDNTWWIIVIVVILLFVIVIIVVLAVLHQKQKADREKIKEEMERERQLYDQVHNAAFAGKEQPFTPGVGNPLYDWYHPQMSRADCSKYLEGQGEGAFVVRDSQATPGWHMLCVKSKNQVLHDKIRLTDDGLYELLPTMPDGVDAPQPKFRDIPELIDHYVEEHDGVPYTLALANPIYDNHQLQNERLGYNDQVRDGDAPALATKTATDGVSNPMYNASVPVGGTYGDANGAYAEPPTTGSTPGGYFDVAPDPGVTA